MIPHTSYKSIFGVFRGRKAAENCFRAMIARGFLPSEIGLLLNVNVRDTEFNGDDNEVAPSEDEVLITGAVEPSVHEQVVRRAKELSAEGAGPDAISTAVREADMYSDGGSGGPTLATLVDVATPFGADGMRILIFGLSFISSQSGDKEAEIDLCSALEEMGFEPQDAKTICHHLKNNAIVLSVAFSEHDESNLREFMLDNSAEHVFVSR